MKRSIRKFWLESGLVIRGAEGEGTDPNPPGEEGSSDTGGDDAGGGDEESSSDEGDDESEEKETFTKEEVENLKKTMREERTERKRLQKELKGLQKGKQDEETKQEADDTAKRIKAAEDRAAKLADGYRTARVEQTITRLAQAANVVDPGDMVALLKAQGYADIDIDQDDDDPSKVEIDEDDVKNAIKKALKTRKHWLKTDKGDDEELPSGSKMRPGGQRKGALDDEQLKNDYPALRMRR